MAEKPYINYWKAGEKLTPEDFYHEWILSGKELSFPDFVNDFKMYNEEAITRGMYPQVPPTSQRSKKRLPIHGKVRLKEQPLLQIINTPRQVKKRKLKNNPILHDPFRLKKGGKVMYGYKKGGQV
jgi:hypothetical protein